MSRIGNKPITVPSGVKVNLSGSDVNVEGPKGKLSMTAHSLMKLSMEGDTITVARPNETREAKSLHGLTRTLIANMIEGVSKGYEKKLKIHGVGYRAEMKGNAIVMQLGFSHPVDYPLPDGVKGQVNDRTEIVLSAIDKQLLGATAAKVRAFRPPEPYGGKGVRYADEHVRRKEGKSGAK
jgi:large subunit ribosomal protein L6